MLLAVQPPPVRLEEGPEALRSVYPAPAVLAVPQMVETAKTARLSRATAAKAAAVAAPIQAYLEVPEREA